MPGLTSQSSFVLQVEGITKQVEEALEFTAELAQILATGRGEAVRVSTHAFRIILQSDTVSNYSANNPDGGPLPFGTGAKWAQFTLLPVPYVIPVQFSMQSEWTGESQQTSIINPVAKSMSDVSKQGAKIRDILLQTNGDGVLGTVASINGTTITMNSGTTATIDGRGAKLVDRQQKVQIQSGGGAFVPRGSMTILERFNFVGGAQTISVDVVPPGTVAGDNVMVDGLPGGAPVFINGGPVFINTTNTGNLMGLPRSLSFVQANGLNAGQSAMSVPMLRIATQQIYQRLGNKGLKGLFWHGHGAPLQSYEELGWQLQYVPLEGGKAKGLDLLFKKGEGMMTIDGRKVYENLHGDSTRFDLYNKDVWLQLKWAATSPFWLKKKGSGDIVFSRYDQPTGAPTTDQLVYSQEVYNWGCSNPSAQGGLTNLKVPVGQS
jgi:hypothetical protein